MSTTAISTFVFFDLETSGLPADEFNRTKIIKLALVACSAEHIAATNTLAANRALIKLPHVLHKLSVCLNPQRMIHPEVTVITGLDNFQLEHEQPFGANTGALLVHFVQQLPQPVCLVAHNGDRFDFPLLRREMDRVGVKLPATLRCVDSLPMFRQIDALEMAQQLAVRPTKRPADCETSAEFDCTQTIMHDLERIVSQECLHECRKLNEPRRQKRFRLQDVHQRLFDCLPATLHCAEADSLALLRCVCAVQRGFLAFADSESKLFADVRPLGR